MSQESSAHAGRSSDENPDTDSSAAANSATEGGSAGGPTTESPSAATQLAEEQARYLRLYADFENFKKRAARERDEVRRATIEGMISRLLPVLDTFDMAMAAAEQPGANVDVLKAGVQMIQSQLRGVFAEQGLEEIDTTGKSFDPAMHDAVSQAESTEIPEGRIVQQLRKGYRLKERLLRPASVVVAKNPATPDVTED